MRSGLALEAFGQAPAERQRSIQFAPDPPHHSPVLVAESVLPALLGKDSVPWILSRFEEPAIFHPSVELTEYAALLPPEVGAADERPVRTTHFDLEIRHRKTELEHHGAAATLSDALATAVGSLHDSSGCPRTSRSRGPIQQGRQMLPRRRTCPQRGVGNGQRGGERKQPRQVDHRSGWTRHGQRAHTDYVFVVQPGRMGSESRVAVTTGWWAAGDVHLGQRNAP